ncbi:hypothetical protein PQJ75_00205 [Rhodoplanes sp. TEM]|uniref:Uncharacterized protein n=1 Tax=Rhodoplanes tepidamans TaxID=200616 RepID=A0ABT5J513_RHOTP|nr:MULTISPECIES: hypothetical protein [Rhodoplanes]MDC7784673.1 hypothetical protein [Rhodoplanes tepidamans]MDC7982140.1 hypothetical protein [Rhodoplanes sp. TEM]MDQ0356142.1 hypothetical protein [Rhodoplanes tepidamans]
MDDRIHAETCVAAIGAIAGFAAQRAMIARLTETGDRAGLSQIHRVVTKDGGTYFFSESLNQMLIAMSDAEAGEKLWPLAAGAAVAAGLDPRHLPNLDAMFSHVAETIGGDLEGMPSVPREHFPFFPVRELLKAVWPMALICFSGRGPAGSPHLGEASIRFWPAIAAHAANALIRQVQPVLAPGVALTIVMEAAIYASKLDPTTI